MTTRPWYSLKSPETCFSPGLLVYPSRIAENISIMLRIAGGADKIRPHIKTHKMAEVIRMQMDQGISRFKCATLAEAELLGLCEAADVLLAMQPVGPNLARFMELQAAFPATAFSTIVDDIRIAHELQELAVKKGRRAAVFIDLDVGMNRTGIRPGALAIRLIEEISTLANLSFRGLHVYDGHIRDSDPGDRRKACDEAFAPVRAMEKELEKLGLKAGVIVAGGSPTFPIHAGREGVETSPGTTLLWDARYGTDFPDMPFLPAAVLLGRVISRPGDSLLCLDLGHKSIAPEMPFPRLQLLGMDDCRQLSQSEEHLVLSCPAAGDHPLGEACYALPMHICPTVAKYPAVITVESGEITGSWKVAARDHMISI